MSRLESGQRVFNGPNEVYTLTLTFTFYNHIYHHIALLVTHATETIVTVTKFHLYVIVLS